MHTTYNRLLIITSHISINLHSEAIVIGVKVRILLCRIIEFDLQIASVFLNGSCYPLTRGNVSLSYNIGNGNQWKTLEECASEGKHT